MPESVGGPGPIHATGEDPGTGLSLTARGGHGASSHWVVRAQWQGQQAFYGQLVIPAMS